MFVIPSSYFRCTIVILRHTSSYTRHTTPDPPQHRLKHTLIANFHHPIIGHQQTKPKTL